MIAKPDGDHRGGHVARSSFRISRRVLRQLGDVRRDLSRLVATEKLCGRAQVLAPWMASMTATVTSEVFALPPRSGV
jgi:hypothetical protein